MAIQKEVNLNEPLDSNALPKLVKKNLTPDYTQAALSLHGDNYRQLQSKLNRYLFWHPYTLSVYLTVIPATFVYQTWDYILISDDIIEYLLFFIKSNDFRFQVLSVFPAIASVMAIIGVTAYFLSDELKVVSDKMITEGYATEIFGFNVHQYSKLPADLETAKDIQLYNQGANTQMIIYRDSPIAICTLNPDFENATNDKLTIRISGLHVRKVFSKVDFESLLLDWSIFRSREIFQAYAKSKGIKDVNNKKVSLLIDEMSFNDNIDLVLRMKGFVVVNETKEINPFKNVLNSFQTLVHEVFGITRKTYELDIITNNEDTEILTKAKENSFLAKEEKIPPKAAAPAAGLRKRKS
ncbi:inorganic phosphate transporter Pho86 [Scheffersomyces xylosifermentans]|uniref:inorganic phosphate transporter Pho86 n=1 Tax=Scheffersomyces xylosifermentans TaxID=1304137 RepID=UPI00315D1419